VPVRSTPTGRRIVWSARSITSNPFRPPESWMKIETRSWVPTAPVNDAELTGQEVLSDGIMQTTPVLATVTETVTE